MHMTYRQVDMEDTAPPPPVGARIIRFVYLVSGFPIIYCKCTSNKLYPLPLEQTRNHADFICIYSCRCWKLKVRSRQVTQKKQKCQLSAFFVLPKA